MTAYHPGAVSRLQASYDGAIPSIEMAQALKTDRAYEAANPGWRVACLLDACRAGLYLDMKELRRPGSMPSVHFRFYANKVSQTWAYYRNLQQKARVAA